MCPLEISYNGKSESYSDIVNYKSSLTAKVNNIDKRYINVKGN